MQSLEVVTNPDYTATKRAIMRGLDIPHTLSRKGVVHKFPLGAPLSIPPMLRMRTCNRPTDCIRRHTFSIHSTSQSADSLNSGGQL